MEKKEMIQYEKVGDDTYHLYTTDENGNVIDIGIDSGTKWNTYRDETYDGR